MSFLEARARSDNRRRGVPHGIHRGARLRAHRRQRRLRGALGPAARRRRAVRDAACGLGARDTLRTEMGYPLHGQDITPRHHPGRGRAVWAVGGRRTPSGAATRRRGEGGGPERRLRGLVAVGRGIPRPGMGVTLTPDVPLGEITSGTFSPTLKKGIGMALIPVLVDPEDALGVQIRGRREIFQFLQAALRRHRPSASHDLPGQPPTFRPPSASDRPWWWQPRGRRRSSRGAGGLRRPALHLAGRRRVLGR